jgi:hypothetical protein
MDRIQKGRVHRECRDDTGRRLKWKRDIIHITLLPLLYSTLILAFFICSLSQSLKLPQLFLTRYSILLFIFPNAPSFRLLHWIRRRNERSGESRRLMIRNEARETYINSRDATHMSWGNAVLRTRRRTEFEKSQETTSYEARELWGENVFKGAKEITNNRNLLKGILDVFKE